MTPIDDPQSLETLSERIGHIKDDDIRAILLDQIAITRHIDRSDAEDDATRFRTVANAEYVHLVRAISEQIEAAEARQTDQPGETLDVRSFGARGDNVHDDTDAFRAAIEALGQQSGRATLRVPAGSYRLGSFSRPDLRTHLWLSGLESVNIVGDGPLATQLIGTHIGSLLRMEDCTDVHIQGIGFDYDPLPFTQGTIVGINKSSRSIDWEAAEGWESVGEWLPNTPYEPSAMIPFSSGSSREQNTGRVLPGGHFPVSRIEYLDGRRSRLYLKTPWWVDKIKFPEVSVGSCMTIHTRSVPGGQCALWIAANRLCEFRDVGVYASWHHAILVCDNESQRFIRCRCEPKPNTGRLAVSNADGFHIRNNRTGPHIMECTVRSTNDDTSNLYSRALSLLESRGPRRIVVDAPYRPEHRATDWQTDSRSYRKGDHLAIIHPTSGEMTALTTIEAVTETWWRGVPRIELTVASDIPPLVSRESLGKRFPVSNNMEFFSVSPADVIEHMVINLALKSDGFVIRQNTFGENHINTIKLKASNGLITENLFDNPTGTGITMCMRLTWQEAFAPRNVVICDNTFRGCRGIDATIDYPGKRRHHGPSYIDNIEIRDNRFENIIEFGLRLANVLHMVVSANEFDGNASPEMSLHESCKRVRFEKNRVNGLPVTAESIDTPKGAEIRTDSGTNDDLSIFEVRQDNS